MREQAKMLQEWQNVREPAQMWERDKKCLMVATTSFQVAKSSGVIATWQLHVIVHKSLVRMSYHLLLIYSLTPSPHVQIPHTWSSPLVTASSPGLWCCSWAARPTNVLVGYLRVFFSAWERTELYSPCSVSSCTSLFQRSLFIASMQAG